MEEWKAIEEVAKDKEDEVTRKLGYALSYVEKGLELLKRLQKEIEMK